MPTAGRATYRRAPGLQPGRLKGRGPAKSSGFAAEGWLGMARGEAAELYSHRRVVGVVVAY